MDGPTTLVAEYTNVGMHAMLSLRPEYYDSITLRIETQLAELTNPTEEAFNDDIAGTRVLTLDSTMQYGDEPKATARKALLKEHDIEG